MEARTGLNDFEQYVYAMMNGIRQRQLHSEESTRYIANRGAAKGKGFFVSSHSL